MLSLYVSYVVSELIRYYQFKFENAQLKQVLNKAP